MSILVNTSTPCHGLKFILFGRVWLIYNALHHDLNKAGPTQTLYREKVGAFRGNASDCGSLFLATAVSGLRYRRATVGIKVCTRYGAVFFGPRRHQVAFDSLLTWYLSRRTVLSLPEMLQI
jgi:hypothetical protein